MNNCLQCHTVTTRPKFCSKVCIKRAWYLNHTSRTVRSLGKREFFNSTTGTGYKWELEAAKMLSAEHLPFNNGISDITWNGKRIDVKAANIYKRKNKRGAPVKGPQKGVWIFNRNKEKPTDFFMCFCLVDGKPEKILLIPGAIFPKKGIAVGDKSKYDMYSFTPKGWFTFAGVSG